MRQTQFRLMPFIFVAVVGTIFGLIWAYLIVPPIPYSVSPNRLSQTSQEQWLLMLAVASDPGASYPMEASRFLANRIPHPYQTIESMLSDPDISPGDRLALQNLLSVLNPEEQGADEIQPDETLQSIALTLLPLIIVVGIGLLIAVIVRLIQSRR